MNWKAILNQIFSIEKFLVSIILVWIYRFGILVITGYMLYYTFAESFLAILFLPLLLVFWRIGVELLYVLFGIHDQLMKINENTRTHFIPNNKQ